MAENPKVPWRNVAQVGFIGAFVLAEAWEQIPTFIPEAVETAFAKMRETYNVMLDRWGGFRGLPPGIFRISRLLATRASAPEER